MKAIILAAGMGTRMGRYGRDVPKGMIEFAGKPLLEWQLASLAAAGIAEVVIVTGYMREAIAYPQARYYHNADYASTNMVESLMCAREELDEDVLVCYADILYTPVLVRKTCETQGTVIVAADAAWRQYWELRYGTTDTDVESFVVRDDRIVELGKPLPTSDGVRHRYIGLIRFARDAWAEVLSLYDRKKAVGTAWLQSGSAFPKGYMTDLLHELIMAGTRIAPCITEKQWLEFDTEQDYERYCEALDNGLLCRYADVASLLGGAVGR